MFSMRNFDSYRLCLPFAGHMGIQLIYPGLGQAFLAEGESAFKLLTFQYVHIMTKFWKIAKKGHPHINH